MPDDAEEQVRDERLALAIAARHELNTSTIERLDGPGQVNHVFLARGDSGAFVIRFAIDPLRQNDFPIEAWCLTAAAAHGIPSPHVVASGSMRTVSYLVQSFVRGETASLAPTTQSWRWLGRYARILHSIELTPDAPNRLYSRFGRDLATAWHAHLDYNIGQLTADDPLIELGVYAGEHQSTLTAAITALRDEPMTFGLNHGDLSLRNLLLVDGEDPVLIDWGAATAGPTPYGDLLTLMRVHLAEDNPTTAELEAFADGYGVSWYELVPLLESMVALHHLDLVRWAIGRRPDLLDETIENSRRGIERFLRMRPDAD